MRFTGRSFLAIITTCNINTSLTQLRGQGLFNYPGYAYALIALTVGIINKSEINAHCSQKCIKLTAEMNSLSPKT